MFGVRTTNKVRRSAWEKIVLKDKKGKNRSGGVKSSPIGYMALENRSWNRFRSIWTGFRLDKSELAIGSIRVLDWQARKKLMLIVALVHAFLLSLLPPPLEDLRVWLLITWCHRTGKRSRSAAAPLYRLRLALSAFWLAFRPFCLPRLN